MYRYAKPPHGTTRISLRTMRRHLSKAGDVHKIRGYLYRYRGVIHAAVMVYGDLGQVRFTGFSWGYAGEGPRGLQELFETLNMGHLDATTIASWPNFTSNNLGTWWEVDIKTVEIK